ncbi:MAG TPA: ROK family protein [Actinospica sp.]|nr:ROK family protein [Actinospica sp.]
MVEAAVQALTAGRTLIGIDVGGTKIDVALADASGEILHRTRLATLAERGPEQALARIAGAVRRLEKTAEETHGAPVAGWAAVCPGVIQDDHIQLTPNLPGWEKLAVSSRLAAELGAPRVRVANDVRAGALAEVRFGALRGVGTGVYLSLGTGIGAALAVDGRVLLGAHQAAGEISYVTPGDAPIDAVAAGRAPLEELVGGRALGRRAAALLGAELTAEQLFRSTDPAARALVHETLELLARTLANLSVFVDPDTIVVGGGMMAAADVILPELGALVRAATPFPPELRPARFLEDASLHGAIALAAEDLVEGA